MQNELSIKDLIPEDSRVLTEKIKSKKYFQMFKSKFKYKTLEAWKNRCRFPAHLVMDFESGGDKIKLSVEGSPHITELPTKIYVDKNVGWLVGFWHAEGEARKGVVVISNSNEELIRKCLETMRKNIGYKNKIRIEVRGKTKIGLKKDLFSNIKGAEVLYDINRNYKYTKPHYRISITNKILWNVLTKIFELSKNLKEFQHGYVGGFIDGDGYVSKGGLLDIRLEKDEYSKNFINFISFVLEQEKIEFKKYFKRQYRIQVTSKKFSSKIFNTFPIETKFKIERLLPS